MTGWTSAHVVIVLAGLWSTGTDAHRFRRSR